MASLNFNAKEVEPASPRGLLTPGRYHVAITATELKSTKAGNGSFLSVEMTVMSGPATSRKMWENLNLDNPNLQTVEIARRTLSAICHAVGVLQVNDSDELLGREMLVDVTIKKRKDTGEDENRITGFSAMSAAPSTPTRSAPPAAKPAAAKAAPWAKAAA